MLRYPVFFLSLFLLACNTRNETMEVIIEKVQMLDAVPSGSGLVVLGDRIFIIGDDATSIYVLFRSTGAVASVPILNADASLYRIRKPVKHDLEAFTAAELDGKKYLLAFGSGSVSPYRDSLLVIPVDDLRQQKWISLGSLYRKLKETTGGKELNIEAALVMEKYLFLLNRNGNEIFHIDLHDLAAIIKTNGQHEAKLVRSPALVVLPESAGIRSGFSGACVLDDRHILFSASAEASPNVYDDGDISGSYIGVLAIDPASFAIHRKSIVAIKDKSGTVIKDKIESIDIAGKYDNGDIRAFAIVDNDDGRSKFIELRLRIMPEIR